MRIRYLLCTAGLLGLSTTFVRAQAPVFVPSPPGPGHVTKSAERPQGVNSPVPSLILNAHTVFLSNGGADAGLFPHPFTGTQDRAYGYAYKALQGGGRFKLVGTPADADLVLYLKLSAPTGSLGGDKQRGTEDALPSLTLVVYDGPTHYVLWTMSQTIDKANLQKTHDKNFDDAVDLLLGQLNTVAAPAQASPPAAASH